MFGRIIVLSITLLLTLPAIAEDDGSLEDKGNSLFNKLMDAAGDALEEKAGEKIDELSGTYKGQIDSLILQERRGNIVIFDVKFSGIKKQDGVFIQREVLYGGETLNVFEDEWVAVDKKSGEMRLSIKFKGATETDDDWGVEDDSEESGAVISDQIRLSLVRESNPDRVFGTLVFDLPKEWTESNEIDQPPATTDEDEAITLAEEEGDADKKPPARVVPGRFIKPGTVMSPVKPTKPLTTKPAVKPEKPTVKPVQVKPATVSIAPIVIKDRYNFFANAAKASWKNGSGQSLPFPGSPKDKRGFVRTLKEGHLHTGNKAVKMIQTHPEWKKRGTIVGTFPLMKFDGAFKFKAVVGFLKGAAQSDGARFGVYIKADGKTRRLAGKTVKPNKYQQLEVDLSRYKGKTCQLILKVDAGRNSAQDWAVWVAPKLEKK